MLLVSRVYYINNPLHAHMHTHTHTHTHTHREVLGMVTMSNTTSKLLTGAAKPSDPVSKVVYRQFEKVHSRCQYQA